MVDPEHIAGRWIQSGRSDLQTFKQKARRVEYFADLRGLAEDMFERIGQGRESKVYEVDGETVIKLSDHPVNLRAEYVIFADPDFRDVTPDVYDHGEDWRWIAVEKVEPASLSQARDAFDDLIDLYNEHERPHSNANILQDAIEYVAQSMDPDVVPPYKQPEWYDEIPSDERQKVESILDLYKTLGLPVYDLKANNFGIDTDGNLVLVDIFVGRVGK